jgi:hypothetical protein
MDLTVSSFLFAFRLKSELRAPPPLEKSTLSMLPTEGNKLLGADHLHGLVGLEC